jgi:hypothetical protein
VRVGWDMHGATLRCQPVYVPACLHACLPALRYHKLTLTLLKASWRRAQRLVASHRTAIVSLAEELLASADETVSGERLVALVEGTPVEADDSALAASGAPPPETTAFLDVLRAVLGKVGEGEGSGARRVPMPVGTDGGRPVIRIHAQDRGFRPSFRLRICIAAQSGEHE